MLSADMQWRIELLGGLRAISSERVITRFRTQKTGALLAYLAYHLPRPLLSKGGSRGGIAHPREVLFELLWPECDPDAGRNRLSTELASLRHQLEPPGVPRGAVIVADRTSVCLNSAAVTTDVAEFEAAVQSAGRATDSTARAGYLADAVELYRGTLLVGYYENWILLEGQRLSELFFQALRQLISHLEEAGDIHRAIQCAQRGVSVDPLRGEAHYELIRLYALAGQPTAALQQYAELERLLREEFNDTSSPATRELARALEKRGEGSGLRVQGSGFRRRKVERRQQKVEVGQPTTDDLQPLTLTPQPLTGRLPLSFTRFFGREQELAHLREMLLSRRERTLSEETRLVTLTGPGGTGKTRLALEAARRLVEPLQGAVWFVPLADISDPRLIADTVRDALHLPRSPTLEPLEQVVDALSRHPSLLVLDNMEHLLSPELRVLSPESQPSALSTQHSALSAVRTLLERVPSLRLLVTSRQLLNLTGEREFLVSPLPTPNGGTETPEWLMRCESVQLFLDRAQAVRPDFQITNANATAIAELCDRLEGIPLAIELAAARAQVLMPAQMVAHMEHRFDFLVSRRRDVTTRHRTLRAAMDWSYQLLSEELQRFFAQLSVFRGGWTLEAAEQVCCADDEGLRIRDERLEMKDESVPHPSSLISHPDVLDFLAQLRECSLILSEEMGQQMRFRMLETLREYAGEQLINQTEAEAVRRRHAEFFVAFAERTEPKLWSPEQEVWLQQLDREHDNVQVALGWALENNTMVGLRLARALARFWDIRGYWSEGREWLERYLSQSPVSGATASELRAAALEIAGDLALSQGDYKRAQTLLEESLHISQQLGDKPMIARALYGLGRIAYFRSNYVQASDFYEESLAIWRELGDKAGMNGPLGTLGNIALVQGNYARARACFEEKLAILQGLGDKQGIALSLKMLAGVAFYQSDFTQARRFVEASLAIWQQLGDKRSVAESSQHLGRIALREGDVAQAYALSEKSLAIFQEIGDKRGVAYSLQSFGEVACRDGDFEHAKTRYKESLKSWQELGDKKPTIECLEGFARVACAQKQFEKATLILAAAAALHEAIGVPLPPCDRADCDRDVAAARAALGEEAFATAWAVGHAMTLEQAVAYALDEGKT